jgi:endonuclease G
MQKKRTVMRRTVKKRTHLLEEKLIELVRLKAQRYLKDPNVTSVGVGHRIKDGRPTDELAIQFTVAKKMAPEMLLMENRSALPKSFTLDDGSEVAVDVIQRSYKASYQIVKEALPGAAPQNLNSNQERRVRQPTVFPGISIGHPSVDAGTLGAVVYDAINGTPYILSNWHVLQGPTGQPGDIVIQPARFDDGNVSANAAGRLVRSHLGLAGDCAIATVIGRGIDERVLELGFAPRRVGKPNIGDRVVKSGRTTGITYGVVTRVGIVAKTNYQGVGIREVGAFEVKPNPAKLPPDGEISRGGDSGSFFMVDTNGVDRDVALGLLFAGETDPHPEEEHALACYIHSVMEKLKISLKKP